MPLRLPPKLAIALSILKIDVDKDWAGYRIRNLGAPVDLYDAIRLKELLDHKALAPIDHPDGSVTTAKIADGAVTTAKVADGAITRAKLSGVFPIGTADIADGAITTAKLADGSVVTVKIADGSVTRAKLSGVFPIGTGDIADSAVTTAKIADGAVTTVKLSSLDFATFISRTSDPSLSAGRIWFRSDLGLLSYSPDGTTVRRIPWGTINVDVHASRHASGGADPLPSGSISSTMIIDGAITTAKIADGAVTTAKIADGAVTRAKLSGVFPIGTADIADGAITTAKIADLAVVTGKIADGAVTTVKIADAAITTAKIADLAVTSAKLASASVTPAKISAVNTPSDGYAPVYDAASGLFRWSAAAGISVHDKTYHQSPTLPDNDVHRTSTPIDHPDGSVTRAKLEYPTVDVSFEYLKSIDKLTFVKTMTYWTILTDSFSDKALEALFILIQRTMILGRFVDTSNHYQLALDTGTSAADFVLRRCYGGSWSILAYEAVDLSTLNAHLAKLSISGTTFKCYREDMATPKFTVTDTAIASGRFGVGEWDINLSSTFTHPYWIYLRAPSSPSPQPIAYFEVPVVGTGSSEDPFRAQLPEEITWDWSLNPIVKKKYDILKKRGFTDEEIIELFPEVLSCRTNRLALTHSALIVSDSATGKPKEYVAIVRIFDQPDRQPHLHPIGRCIGELQRMKGVRRLSRDEAIRRAKQLDDKLHDVDLLPAREIGRDRKALKREYVDWRRSQFNVEMEDNIAEQYVDEDKGW